ncbi:DUF1501 domain-containing protein [Planctomycetes bacterium K23_9]|uniref:Sulfatase n=1 Tax=Stieleria marina TaxID=1930275 RepID=A0A517NRV3_9BACT|nr:hypothetical protein K239x_18260 [Planctomycetes bacterium K23_9]
MLIHRRRMLQESALGFGSLALTSMLLRDAQANDASPTVAPGAHHPATAKSVIFLFMSGAPGQTDTFDPKPSLAKLDGQQVPDSIAATVPNIPRSGVGSKLFASPFSFRQYGESGIPVSSLYPRTAELVDDMCIVRSMNHRVPVHGPGECIALTGTGVGDRPSMGAWMNYGLGSEAQDLPGFMVFLSNVTGPPPQLPGWSAGFLPAQYQGTLVDGRKGVPYTDMPSGYTETDRRRQLDFISELNHRHIGRQGPDSELEARIASYELGYRMQASAPETFDLSRESQHTREMYGLDQKETSEFGTHCLLARRLVERGVRCIQLRNGGWDAHSGLESNHLKGGKRTDQPIAALLQDLKQRGLLESTLVVWGGEFGRTPTIEGSRTGKSRGRDHSPAGYTMWLTGGGVRGGQIIGATDELGYVPIERPLTPADMHATLLHAMGIDQHRLSWNHNNRDEIPTVFGGEVIQEVFA